MIGSVKSFLHEEDGAVTVDWVVLTAAVVGLAIAAWTTIDTQTTNLNTAAAGAISTSTTF